MTEERRGSWGPERSYGRKRILTHLRFSKRISWQQIFNRQTEKETTDHTTEYG